MPANILTLVLCLAAVVEVGCGGGTGTSGNPTPTPPTQQTQVTFNHVVIVVEENHGYADVVGNSGMPYFNSLVSQYGVASQYYANAHPSLPNYFVLTNGLTETFDDNFTGTVSDDNVVRELVNAGKTWKCYAESIPSEGYLGGDSGNYLRHHNPFTYLSDIQNDPAQAANIVPFTDFGSDLAANALPQYSFIVPDVNDDAHNGTLAQADSWLQTNIAPLLASSSFQSSGLLVITFDEGDATDSTHGGGQVATLIVSSQAKKGYQSTTFYQHQSVLRLALEASGVSHFPGLAASSPDMTEFFNGH